MSPDSCYYTYVSVPGVTMSEETEALSDANADMPCLVTKIAQQSALDRKRKDGELLEPRQGEKKFFLVKAGLHRRAEE